MTEADEDKYPQAEAYLDQRQIRRHKRQYEKDTRDVIMITTYEQAFDTTIHVTPVCLLLKSLSVCFTFVNVFIGVLCFRIIREVLFSMIFYK